MNVSETIQVRVNGKDRDIESGKSVHTLLASLELHPAMVVVELNKEILGRDAYERHQVQEGDTIEIVHFVGGG